MIVNIVTSKEIIDLFRAGFKEFKADLGKSFTATPAKNNSASQSPIDIKDWFVENFINETSKFCYKMGRMGSINFYTCPGITDQIWMYAKAEKLVFNYKKGTYINTNFLGAMLVEMESRLESNNSNSFSGAMNNYYNKSRSY